MSEASSAAGDEVLARGCCDLHIDAIAARAGVCRTTTQNALRMVRKLGWSRWRSVAAAVRSR
jgi:hypothetical protein